jgi:hypothetical protein
MSDGRPAAIVAHQRAAITVASPDACGPSVRVHQERGLVMSGLPAEIAGALRFLDYAAGSHAGCGC